jgi:serine/threonine protein kinase
VLLNIPHNSKVDIWAMGIIIFYLLYSELPFGDKSKKHIREFIIKDRIPFIVEQHDYVSLSNSLSINNDDIVIERKLRLLIKLCLEHNVRSRSSAQMILQQFFYVNN